MSIVLVNEVFLPMSKWSAVADEPCKYLAELKQKNKKEEQEESYPDILKKAVDIAAMWNTKGLTVDAEFNIKHVQEWSRSQSIPSRKPRLALLGLWEGVWDCTVCFYIYFFSSH